MKVAIGKRKFSSKEVLTRLLRSSYGFGVAHTQGVLSRLGAKASRRIKAIGIHKFRKFGSLTIHRSLFTDLSRYRYRLLVKHQQVGTYKGIRARQGLPRNGQRTHSNAGTPRRFFKLKRIF